MLIPGRFWRPRRSGTSATPVASVPAFGPAGAATFVLELDPGTKITYSWATEIIASYSGKEQRISYQALPGVRVEGPAFLLDADSRTTRAALMRDSAAGATFLVALPNEEQVVNDVTITTVSIDDTSVCDWAQTGQRVVLIGIDGTAGTAIIQSTTASQLVLDAIPAGVTAIGARIMPLIPAILDPQQGFTRHPVTVDYWNLRAKAVAYGWCGIDVMGAGADVLTFDAGLVAVSALTDDNLIIWDRPNLIDGTAAETLASKTDLVDLGGLAFAAGGSPVPDWIRPIKMRSNTIDDLQWLKAVARHLRGAQGMFLLPTGRPDFVVAEREVATFVPASVPVTTRTTSLVLAEPTGTREGDTVLAFIWTNNFANAAVNTGALPAGWSVLSILESVGQRALLLRRIAMSSGPTSHTFLCTANPITGAYITGICIAYRGLDISAPLVDSGISNIGGSTFAVSPSLTLANVTDLYLGFAFAADNTASATVPPGTIELVNTTATQDGFTRCEIFDIQPLAVGPTGTNTTTFSHSVGGVAVAYAFAVVPTPAVDYGKIAVVGDYTTWFESVAHRRLAVTTESGIVQYLTATSVVDNGDGTNTISLNDAIAGSIETISFLEQVRLETDDVSLVWDGATFTSDLVAHVVQDTTAAEEIVTSTWAGHGLDGDITFPVGTYSMTRDMFWETGTLQSGSVIVTNGFVPHFRTALIGPPTGIGTIRRNGANASGSTGGAGFATGTGTLGGGSGTGATGTTGSGSTASAFGFWPTTNHPGLGGSGGGGTNTGGAAGGGPSSLQADSVGSLDVFATMRMRFMTGSTTAISGGAGGSSGGGNGTQAGGGGGAGAGNVAVAAGQFLRETSILIQANGGSGGAGAGSNCGGGGGGGGGLIAIAAGRLPFPMTDNSGGAGGASGGGTGLAGLAGSAGPAPMLFVG